MKSICVLVALALLTLSPAAAGTKHSPSSRYPSYEGRILCGYQGWFRAEGDGSGRGWVHSYNLHNIGLEKLLDFLKHDPEYGGCSVLLGVPNYFRDLRKDTIPDPYLYAIMAQADVILPWMVGRFSASLDGEIDRYGSQIAADQAWCSAHQLDYVPCVYPGFSWYNLSHGCGPHDAIPRLKGRFYWGLMTTAIQSGAKMIYVAMFDEMDEGTAIFKCTRTPPAKQPPATFLTYEDLPSDHYLWLTGQAGRILRGEVPADKELYQNTSHELTKTAKR